MAVCRIVIPKPLVLLLSVLLVISCVNTDARTEAEGESAKGLATVEEGSLLETSPANLWTSYDDNPFRWKDVYVGNRVKLTLEEFGAGTDGISVNPDNGSGVLKHAITLGMGWMPSLYCEFSEGYWNADNYHEARRLNEEANATLKITLTGTVAGTPDMGRLNLSDCEHEASGPGFEPDAFRP